MRVRPLAFATFLVWRLRIGGYGLALAALALVVFGAYDSYPSILRVECSDSFDSQLSLALEQSEAQDKLELISLICIKPSTNVSFSALQF